MIAEKWTYNSFILGIFNHSQRTKKRRIIFSLLLVPKLKDLIVSIIYDTVKSSPTLMLKQGSV